MIKFYSSQGPYGYMSNFYKAPIKIEGEIWPTVEHYFQAQKFKGTKYVEKIRAAKTPKVAARMGRDRRKPLRKDWESVKELVMFKALMAKFNQHGDLKKLLLATDDEKIIENSPVDYYWGCGANGTGKNRLGFLLEKVRKALKEI